MAKQAGITTKQGRELGPVSIMPKDQGMGILWLRRYGLLRQIDEERLRQRISTRKMPGNYSILMKYGNPTLAKLLLTCDALGIQIQLVRKDGEIL